MLSRPLRDGAQGGGRTLRAVLEDPALRIPLTYFVVAQLLDIITTLMGLVVGLSEVNPVTASVLLRFGAFGLVVQKVPTILAVAVAATLLPRRAAIAAAWAFTAFMAAVIASNVGLLAALHSV
ncbi:MAG TPA: hypothetical protein VFO60_01665 [Candidatus Dormibacteraeota bacterium]|nr:hypothetical protein [Candidatus Dormibacteraeota bacterium]